MRSPNPFLTLPYEPAFEHLGEDYADPVAAAEFPQHLLRFRNDDLLPQIGLEPAIVSDEDFLEAFGQFRDRQPPRPLLAMRYHGYQFGDYNPRLGDGRGFLYGQLRGKDGELYDLGTKGSGTTPYSRGGDGSLTLKGGVREVLAAEALHRLGVRTSRCLSLVETGEPLWRGDEPSPTRSSVMVRFSRSHIRFGTFERLHFLGRKDLTQTLLDHVLEFYYPHLQHEEQGDRYAQFYAELVQRVAELTAQWMSVGFCHAVLNTDNMAITGESFDYGPYAFITQYDPKFTAAYFDHYGRYCYGNQPSACVWNLQMLQVPLKGLIDSFEMEAALAQFETHYLAAYRLRMLHRLGFDPDQVSDEVSDRLLRLTLQLLWESKVSYHDFFSSLRQQFSSHWRQDGQNILSEALNPTLEPSANVIALLEQWRSFYHQILLSLPETAMEAIARRLAQHNPNTVLIRPEIEAVWEAIATENDWQPFYELIKRLRNAVVA